MQYNKYNAIQYNTIQHNTIQYNIIQYNTIKCKYDIVQDDKKNWKINGINKIRDWMNTNK